MRWMLLLNIRKPTTHQETGAGELLAAEGDGNIIIK